MTWVQTCLTVSGEPLALATKLQPLAGYSLIHGNAVGFLGSSSPELIFHSQTPSSCFAVQSEEWELCAGEMPACLCLPLKRLL